MWPLPGDAGGTIASRTAFASPFAATSATESCTVVERVVGNSGVILAERFENGLCGMLAGPLGAAASAATTNAASAAAKREATEPGAASSSSASAVSCGAGAPCDTTDGPATRHALPEAPGAACETDHSTLRPARLHGPLPLRSQRGGSPCQGNCGNCHRAFHNRQRVWAIAGTGSGIYRARTTRRSPGVARRRLTGTCRLAAALLRRLDVVVASRDADGASWCVRAIAVRIACWCLAISQRILEPAWLYSAWGYSCPGG